VPVAVASKSGSFHFETAVLPPDCVGTVGDGGDTVPAVLQFCGPPGPPGSPGPPGQPGQDGAPGAAAPASTMIDTFIYVGNGAPTTFATLGGLSFEATCLSLLGGQPPVQPTLAFGNVANGGKINLSLVVTDSGGRVGSADGAFASGVSFDASNGTLIGLHGMMAAAGGLGAVRVDFSVFVTNEPIFGAVACRVLGLLTPTT